MSAHRHAALIFAREARFLTGSALLPLFARLVLSIRG